ncbi:MAG: GAF domain-containing protein [Flavobacteriales bacterium]|nr:GAF domain-containing protein [Flavobacteriales bacterium]
MSKAVLFELIQRSSSPIVVVKQMGDIVVFSKLFQDVILTKLPLESNFLEMMMHTTKVHPDFFGMFKNKEISEDITSSLVHIDDNTEVTLKSISPLIIDEEKFFIIFFEAIAEVNNDFVKCFISSQNLFIHAKTPSLVYGVEKNDIVSINISADKFLLDYKDEDEELSKEFIEIVESVISIARVGGIASKIANFDINGRTSEIKLETYVIDDDNKFFLVQFSNFALEHRADEILDIEKERLENLITVVPGVLFEFEVIDNKLKFTFVSEKVKEILGLSATHILKDSNLLFSRFDRIERVRLHYFFLRLSEKERRLKNEFTINDDNKKTKWVTIDWHEYYSDDKVFKGTGYLNDITDKKNFEKEEKQRKNRKQLKEYFSLLLLRQPTIPLILEDLAKSLVTKLNLQNSLIYLYNSSTQMLDFGAAYRSKKLEVKPKDYLKNISTELGVIGRVVRSQTAEIVNDTLTDGDYYSLDKPQFSEITVPVIFEGELIGIIDSDNSRHNYFTQEHLDILKDVADDLAVRLVQKKRQDDNLKFYSTLSSFYEGAKIFDWKINFKTNKLNNSGIDFIIDIIGINDKKEKISIYENPSSLFKYVLHHDAIILSDYVNSLRNNILKTDDLEFRIITNQGNLKWLKIFISNILLENDVVVGVEGTLKDISELKSLEHKNRGLESLLSSINVAQLQLERDYNFAKSLGLVGSALGISKAIISKFTIENDKLNYFDKYSWDSEAIVADKVGDDCYFSTLSNRKDSLELFEENYYIDISNIDLSDNQKAYLKKYKVKSLLGFLLKTPQGTWGAIYFIVKNNKRVWLDYEKNLLSGYASFIALKLQNIRLAEGYSKV